MLETNKIYCGDCLELMKELPDKSVDLVLTDPPYGKKPVGHFGQKSAISFSENDYRWDIKPSIEYFNEIFRISKNQIIWGMNYFIDYLKPTNSIIIWNKRNGNNPYADAELAWTSYTSAVKNYDYFWLGSHAHRIEKIYHPTQKATQVIQLIIADYSNPSDIILDPFIGSGTTAVAAIRTDRQFIGMEISPEYCKIAEKRIFYERQQLKLDF